MMNRKIMMAVLCFIVAGAALAFPVSAYDYQDQIIENFGSTEPLIPIESGTGASSAQLLHFKIYNNQADSRVSIIIIKARADGEPATKYGEGTFTLNSYPDGVERGSGICYYTYTSSDGLINLALIFDEGHYLQLAEGPVGGWEFDVDINVPGYSDGVIQRRTSTYYNDAYEGRVLVTGGIYNNARHFLYDTEFKWRVEGYWQNTIQYDDLDNNSFTNVGLVRDGYYSSLYVEVGDEVKWSDYDDDDIDGVHILADDTPVKFIVNSVLSGMNYTYSITGGSGFETSNNVSVYTQFRDVITGANIPGSVNFTNGANSTIYNFPSGYGYAELEKNIWYDTIATSSGYETIEQENLFSGDSGLMFWMEPTAPEGSGENSTVYNLVVQGQGAGALAGATVTVQGYQTKVTNSNGAVQFNLQRYTPYTVTTSYTGFVSFTQTINITQASYTDYITLLVDPTGPYATPTPTQAPGESGDSATIIDLRTTNEKAEDALDIWFDNAETISALGVMVVFVSMIGWLVPKKRR